MSLLFLERELILQVAVAAMRAWFLKKGSSCQHPGLVMHMQVFRTGNLLSSSKLKGQS